MITSAHVQPPIRPKTIFIIKTKFPPSAVFVVVVSGTVVEVIAVSDSVVAVVVVVGLEAVVLSTTLVFEGETAVAMPAKSVVTITM